MKIIAAIALSLLTINSYGQEIISAPDSVENDGHDQQHSSSSVNGEYPLFQAMSLTSLNEVPLSTVEAIEASDAIVRGHIVSITDGRLIEHVNGFSHPIKTALIKAQVSKVLKGEVGEFVYFEYVVGGIPAQYMNERKYTEDMLLLLTKPTWSESAYRFTDSPTGLMGEVDTLYRLTTQRGLLIEESTDGGKRIIQPLAEGGDPLFIGQSFSDLGLEIPALNAGGSYGFGPVQNIDEEE